MPLTMLSTGLASPAYQDWQDWTIYADGEPVGRIYEDSSRGTSADLRWFWSIATYVQPVSDIRTSGRVPTLGQAKADWRSWTAYGKQRES
jgi:hypothetical protein